MAQPATLAALLGFRLLNAALTQTFFQPDEFWQSLEVAHAIVFGYGYSTWEWHDARTTASTAALAVGQLGSPVRSVAYPVLFVPVYWLLKVTRLDNTVLLTLLPRLLQAVFAALGDWYAFKLAARVSSPRTAWIWLVLTWTSPYALHTATRTFSNSLEASLTAAALYYWPTATATGTRASRPKIWPALVPMAIAFIIRPTSAVLWVFLGATLLWQSPVRAIPNIVFQCGSAVLLALGVQVLLDSLYFGKLTVTALAFLQVNVLDKSPISLFYGHSASHYYLSQAFPVICTAVTPWAAVGWVLASWPGRTSPWLATGVRDLAALKLLARAALWVTLCMSTLGHKEWRFLQPLGPLWLLFAAIVLDRRRQDDDAERKQAEDGGEDEPRTFGALLGRAWRDVTAGGRSSSKLRKTSTSSPSPPPAWPSTILDRLPPLHFLLYAQVPLAAYLLLGHGRGQTQVMRLLHAQRDSLTSVGFLMPCHSTPWQAWLHAPELERAGSTGDGGLAWFLSCEPPLRLPADGDGDDGDDPTQIGHEGSKAESQPYRDQTRVFFDDPYAYLETRFPAVVDPTFPPSPYPRGRRRAEWTHTWPSHLVLFDSLLAHKRRRAASGASTIQEGDDDGDVGEFFRRKGYVETDRLWNGLGSDDENRWGDVLVLAWRPEEGR